MTTPTDARIVHRAPEGDAATLACCGAWPLEHPDWRITNDDALVTCPEWRGPSWLRPSHPTPTDALAAALLTEADRAAVRHAAMLAHTSLWDIGGLGHDPEDWTLCKREPCPTMARLAALRVGGVGSDDHTD